MRLVLFVGAGRRLGTALSKTETAARDPAGLAHPNTKRLRIIPIGTTEAAYHTQSHIDVPSPCEASRVFRYAGVS